MREPDSNELVQLEEELSKPLSAYLVSSPKPEETRRLLTRLQSEFDQLREQASPIEFPTQERVRTSFWKQCFNQLRIYHKAFWGVSILIFAMLTLMTGTLNFEYQPAGSDFFSILLPIFILAGTAFSFRSWNKEMRTVEQITPFPPALLILSRLLIILTMILVLGFFSTVYLHVTMQTFPFLHFLMYWVSLSLFLGGSLAYGIYRKGVITGVLMSFLSWAVYRYIWHWLVHNQGWYSDLLWMAQLVFLLVGIAALGKLYRNGSDLKSKSVENSHT